MSKYKDSFSFELNKPIQCQTKVGDKYELKEVKELILKAPNMKSHYRIGNILQALLTPAMLKSCNLLQELSKTVKKDNVVKSESLSEEEDKKIADKILINYAIVCLGKEINDFYDSFEELLLSDEICFIGGFKFSQMELNLLDYEDFKRLVVEYTANFFIASWMKNIS